MAKLGNMTITVKADETITRFVKMEPLIKRLVELLESHDSARGLTPDDADSGQPCPNCNGNALDGGGRPYRCDVCGKDGQA